MISPVGVPMIIVCLFFKNVVVDEYGSKLISTLALCDMLFMIIGGRRIAAAVVSWAVAAELPYTTNSSARRITQRRLYVNISVPFYSYTFTYYGETISGHCFRSLNLPDLDRL
jgi:hypothetical protein